MQSCGCDVAACAHVLMYMAALSFLLTPCSLYSTKEEEEEESEEEVCACRRRVLCGAVCMCVCAAVRIAHV